MKRFSTFLKAPGQKLHHQMQLSVISRTLVGWVGVVFPLCRDTVNVFYNPIQLGLFFIMLIIKLVYLLQCKFGLILKTFFLFLLSLIVWDFTAVKSFISNNTIPYTSPRFNLVLFSPLTVEVLSPFN